MHRLIKNLSIFFINIFFTSRIGRLLIFAGHSADTLSFNAFLAHHFYFLHPREAVLNYLCFATNFSVLTNGSNTFETFRIK